VSDIRFAHSDDVHVAYQVLGGGPVDLVYVQGAYSHLGVQWELPAYRRFCERLGEFTRLILFDKRGMGLSDRVPEATPLEARMDDIRAVMDAAGSEQAVIMGASEGGPLAMLFAAAHPTRTRALILMGAEVRERRDDDWPWGEATEEEFETSMARIEEAWGLGGGIASLAPSVADEPWAREWTARLQLNSATPGAAKAFMRMAFNIDVRDVVPSIRTPTLVLHATGDGVCHVENGRFLARTIPDARYVELPGEDHLPWFDPDRTIAEIRQFLTGTREPVNPDRVLATILFTDVVASTERAVSLGDERWRQLLESHNSMVRQELGRFRGREVNTAGDGFLATFDGPARAIRCGLEIIQSAERLGLEVRAGVHTGEVEQIGDDVAGITVHTGARIAGLAEPGEVLASRTVRDLVAGSGLAFTAKGRRELRGVPGQWELFSAG
jgi:class 3 adenylate cyclase